ncbi:MAG: hypothetical protein NC310_02895 [Roseburia sp.]|nr:hypothetical protein [Anaeroplasma bactoclasticum]MCM1196005.1 hypothetical protein [Roseburia sp.]MCM1556835.1 hypothetical protein [Anaeroplasma bactoclasticum]
MPRTIRDYKYANIIMHYKHPTSVSATNSSNHIMTCNSIETIFPHEYIENNCCSIKCKVCSYIFYTQPHIYTDKYISKSSTIHYAYCRCGSMTTKSHSFYTENDFNICSQCGYKISVNHNHEYTYHYLPIRNSSRHTAFCSCGDSKTEPCFAQAVAGQTASSCVKCGQGFKSLVIYP